jgi:hypothetical protein
MTITNQYIYGTEAVEFFKHDDEALKSLITQREVDYFRRSESLLHPQTGVHIGWNSNQPLAVALRDLTELLLKGYKVVTAYSKPLDLNVQLRKPDTLIESDLIRITEQTKTDYAEERYARNVAETRRQLDITIAKRARDAAAVAAKAAEGHQASEEEFALADLLKAYTNPTKPKIPKSPR